MLHWSVVAKSDEGLLKDVLDVKSKGASSKADASADAQAEHSARRLQTSTARSHLFSHFVSRNPTFRSPIHSSKAAGLPPSTISAFVMTKQEEP